MKFFDSELAVKILKSFKKEKQANICGFNGNFEIAPDFSLEVQIYSKTQEKRFPTFNKYSKPEAL